MAKHRRSYGEEEDHVGPLRTPKKRMKRNDGVEPRSATSSMSTKRGMDTDGQEATSRKKRRLETGAVVATAGECGRKYTLSIAVPGSVIDNTQTLETATLVAGQLARAAAIFNVDEVVVVDDSDAARQGGVGSGAAFLARILQYMETPQYLRRALIPMHPDLCGAGRLPPLDAPHHLRASEWGPYREGVVLRSAEGVGSLVDIGLDKSAYVEHAVRQGVRVTLHMGDAPRTRVLGSGLAPNESVLEGRLVLPSEPRENLGQYWGYSTRIAASLDAVFSESPFPGGYDLKVGTSERGTVQPATQLGLTKFDHMLVAFGGPLGLEACMPHGLPIKAADPSRLFDKYINTCPGQGSRTIRSEEAILISLAYLQPAISGAVLAGA